MPRDQALRQMEVAQLLAAADFTILPLHYPIPAGAAVSCSCAKPQCSNCGKHPMFRIEASATTSMEQVIRHWQRFPLANVGLFTGVECGIFILDVDLRSGGSESIEKLRAQTGLDLGAPTVFSGLHNGERSKHYYFQHPGGHVTSRGWPGFPGLDIKGDGGYIVAPSSLHKSAVAYECGARGMDAVISPPPCPAELLELLREAGIWKVDEANPADILKKSDLIHKITSTCSNYVRQFGCSLIDSPWAQELIFERGPQEGVSWNRADFRRRSASDTGHTYVYAKQLTGQLYRYAATVGEAEQVVEYIVSIAVRAERWPDLSDNIARSPDEFIATVLSLYRRALAKPSLNDYAAWRVGYPVHFHEEMLQALLKLRPPLRSVIYALECRAQRRKRRAIHIAQPWLRRWLTHVCGTPASNWDAWKHIRTLEAPRRYHPRWDKLLTRLDDSYRLGRYGKKYLFEHEWNSGPLLHHVEVEQALELPSMHEFSKGWAMPDLEMC